MEREVPLTLSASWRMCMVWLATMYLRIHVLESASTAGLQGTSSWPHIIRVLPTKRLLRQFARGTPLDQFGLECAPSGVVDAERPFQHDEFRWTQVFFGEVAEATDCLLFHSTLFNGARPDPREPLQLEQFLRQHGLQLFKRFHASFPA